MDLTGLQFTLVLLLFLAVALVVGLLSSGRWPVPRTRRREGRDRPLVDETGPYEVPEDDAPSRSDD